MNLAPVMNIFSRGNSRRRRIAAIGMFDGVHMGHRYLIEFLKKEGQKRSLTPTVVTFSEHPLAMVRPSESPPLITTVDRKMALLQEAGIDDCVLLPFTDRLRRQSARQFLKRLKDNYAVDALVIGFNHSFGHDRVTGIDAYRVIGEEVGIEVIPAPEYNGPGAPVSSSVIRNHITEGRFDAAVAALGHTFVFDGIVTAGNRIGRTLGYPTANVAPSVRGQLLPPTGVFAAIVTTEDGERYGAMVNVGRRPTLGGQGEIRTEVNIFDYLGYLYGQKISVEFLERIRDERRFATLDRLKSQLASDEQAARRILATRM